MLSKNIKKFRAELGLTQEALAKEAGISYNTVIKIESGGIANPRMQTLKKLAKALKVKIDDLI